MRPRARQCSFRSGVSTRPGRATGSTAVEASTAFVALLIGCSPHGASPTHPRLRSRVEAPEGTDVANYTLDARLDARRRVIDATERIEWRNTSSTPVNELWWHLYMNAFEGPDSLFMRSGGLGGHRGHSPHERGRIEVLAMRDASGADLLATASDDPAVPRDHTQLHTVLPRTVAPGESITLNVTFRTTLPSAFARTGYFDDFVFAAQWFPKLAVLDRNGTWAHFPFHSNSEFYADFGRYDVTLTVPRGDIVGASGIEDAASQPTRDGERHHFVAEHVHDFAWTSWPDFRDVWTTIGSVAVRVLSPPGSDGVVDRVVVSLERAMPTLANRLGPYPYPQLTVVIPPRGAGGVGGMEYPTLITCEGEWFVPRSVHVTEWVAVHEFAHQYFYGLLASNESAYPFLDEGLTEYVTGRVLEQQFGAGREMFDGLGLRLGYESLEGGMAAMIHDRLPAAVAASQYPSFGSYGDHVYRRTAAVFESAERLYGRDTVDRALSLYAAHARFTHPTPETLWAALSEVDPRLGDFVQRALVGPGSLDDAVEAVEFTGPGSTRTTRVHLRREGDLQVSRTLEVEWIDGSRRSQTLPPRTTVASFESPLAPRAARIDPDASLPIDSNRLDDARLALGAQPRSSANVTGRLAFFIDLLLRWVGP